MATPDASALKNTRNAPGSSVVCDALVAVNEISVMTDPSLLVDGSSAPVRPMCLGQAWRKLVISLGRSDKRECVPAARQNAERCGAGPDAACAAATTDSNRHAP